MKMSNALHVEKLSGSVLIRFDRPEARSPLSIAVVEDLREILSETTKDAAVERIIFTGGADVFASGADLREIAAVDADSAREFAERGQRLMNFIADSKQQTIAAINGFCFGGALDLAVACHRRIAAPEAVFCHPGVSLGIITGWSGTQRLPRLIGEAAALEMFLTAKRIDAAEALRINLIDEISDSPLEDSLANRRVQSSS